MAANFNFTGKIALGKDSEKFHPIERKEFSSNWMNTTVKFNCVSGTNRVLCMTQGGKWKDDKKNVVKTFGKSTTDANGNVIKGTAIEIPWAKRFDQDQIDKVAGFKKFVVDTGDYKMRYKLQNLVTAFEKGTVTDEMIAETEIDNLDDAKTALEKSQAKRKEFVAEWDFAEYMIKVAQSDKMKDKLFNISGTYEVSYNADKDRFYTNYHVNRVTLAAEDAEPKTEMKIDFYYGEGAWDDSTYDETGKCFVNGWVDYYDSNLKKTGFKPTVVVVREDDEKKRKGFKRKFVCDEEIKQIGLTLSVIEGAEVIELTMDMLDEETREDIECGLLDFEDVKRELGGRAIGDRVSELRFVELTAKKNKPQDTVYSVDDMHHAREDVVEDVKDEVEVDDEDVNVDLFADDDDL
jgi:hypothetical protein